MEEHKEVLIPKSKVTNHQNNVVKVKEQNNSVIENSVSLGRPSMNRTPFTFIWQNVSFEIKQGMGKTKKILNNVNGFCNSGELTSIMGPSGSGKTSLLNILSNRVVYPPNSTHSSNFYINNIEVSSKFLSKVSSYVQQDDILFDTMTPNEIFSLAYQLRYKLNDKEVEENVTNLIIDLKLQSCRNTRVGNHEKKGLSGGERKRVSVGLEIIADSKILFLDEPTSGLDSSTSYVLVSQLRELARTRQKIILMTIHQPSTNIFNLFERLFLINLGNVIYQGPVSNVIYYFNTNIAELNERSNPADAIMHLIEETNFKMESEKFKEAFSNVLQDQIEAEIENKVQKDSETTKEFLGIFDRYQGRAGFLKALKLLIWRTFIHTFRSYEILILKGGATVIFIFLILSMFKLENNEVGVSERGSLCYLITILIYFQNIFSTMLTFPAERAVVLREMSGNMYQVLPYYLAKNIIETPLNFLYTLLIILTVYYPVGFRTDEFKYAVNFMVIGLDISFFGGSFGYFLGIFFTNLGVAMMLLAVTAFFFQFFAGFLVSKFNIVAVLRWIRYLSPFYYGIQASLRNEMDGNTELPSNLAETIGLNDFSVWTCITILFIYCIVLRIFGYIFLRLAIRKK